LFREFAVTLAVTIIFSAFVSLTLTPMMAARILKHRPQTEQGKLYRWSEWCFVKTIEQYGKMLRLVLRHQTLTLLVAAGTLGLTIYLYVIVPKGFFPVQDTGTILGISQAPETVSFSAMSRLQQELVRVIRQDPAVENLTSFIGADGVNTTMNSGRIQITLRPLEQRAGVSAVDVIRRLEPKLQQVAGIELFMQPVQDLTVEDRISRTQYQYSLDAPDKALLDLWVPRLVDRMKQLPELRGVASDQQNNGLGLFVDIDRDTAGRLGITPQNIDDALYDSFGQRQVSTIYTQTNQFHVILEVAPRFQQDASGLSDMYVPTGAASANLASTIALAGTNTALTGAATIPPAPLKELMKASTIPSPITINHQSQFPVVTLSFNLAPGASLGAAVQHIKQVTQELGMPASIEPSFQGTAHAFESSLENESTLILAAIITVYIVLGMLYESFIHPITILSTLPSAGVGAILALVLFKKDLDVIALIGVILLIGIVKKNAIMMIDFALEAERNEGKPPQEAIYQACLLRFRPIMMTTMAALLGAVPLAFGTGVGSELRTPLGICIIGGLLVSQVMTLFTTPVIYLFFGRIAAWVRRPHGSEEGEQLSSVPG
jgi:multidrug efflux pump